MTKIKAWIAAARLRTLPLSVSGIIVGASLGNIESMSSSAPLWTSCLFWLAILATIGFQVLSNFANDYGDGIRGTDANREGEKRMVASGIISPKQMKIGMIITGVITFFLATILIFSAFRNENFIISFVFFNLTIVSIIAAVKYTVGKKAYGYSGLGDVFVFLFFGLLSVLGSYYLFTHNLHWQLILPATAIGCFSTAVLNLNNMRDIENDSAAGKNTLVVKLGIQKAKKYHAFLLLFGMVCAVIFTVLNYSEPIQFVYLIAFIPFLLNLKTVFKNKVPIMLDGELKKVALSTFLFAILFTIFI
ncbi:MAG: 1,4-dihydroxy-2-naphthoate octaprenyltransferase [Flavobacteriaceae bacterium CG_4_8_14_3_um_filter_34_10]|nr:1,4-dihydroxy-2-naphthoate octaprenyltransferase [Flavobacteriia bacterium]OIP51248.1 MAG: 1,4-dihydroxy-2-naphthoate octaprenyltransferase [Flavobacteriaceae bacterium CG2_30_34_30]PIQ17435.1 MAG: 1,4-dihydroxy-2-naphthoate octaprenyltransferase [Flavobacteriaceae bacterium CG18_big_fil_WC_8_21_14_2_50_34_36]PIV50870.1 MAG: 1,4-dihydroxy-2-naphthoate octaprenyltransferase [Flavobacteriaceae bacterium CG02_land_8_20_14_3_00_34_13]PIX09786.1 MAG: 1,4-dihydroxy-2-naphthoate octaprenyltransfera